MLNKIETDTLKGRYSKCFVTHERKDIVFAFALEFNFSPQKIEQTANMLQDGYVWLKETWNLDPSTMLGSKVVIGYRHPDDETYKTECSPGWGWGSGEHPNWINIPWSFWRTSGEPLECCSHELVHPFVHCACLSGKNRFLKEGLCDAFRAGVAKAMGIEQFGAEQAKKMRNAAKSSVSNLDLHQQEYHYIAGKFLSIISITETAPGTIPSKTQYQSLVKKVQIDSNVYMVALPCPWLERAV